MVTAVRPLHPEKAELLIWVTLSGMVMAIRLLHPEKAELPIIVTLPGMVVFLQPATNVFDAVSIMALHPSRVSYFALSSFTTIELRFMHLKKASLLMLVRPLPMVAEVRLLQNPQRRVWLCLPRHLEYQLKQDCYSYGKPQSQSLLHFLVL